MMRREKKREKREEEERIVSVRIGVIVGIVITQDVPSNSVNKGLSTHTH